MAEAAGCQLYQFERSRFQKVPRLANLVAMFGQFVRRRVVSNIKAIVTACHGCFFGNIEIIERPKM